MAEYKSPRKTKYRKQQKGTLSGIATSGASVSFGQYGLKALEAAWITSRQIEAARVAISRSLRRAGKCGSEYFRIACDTKAR
jgi:LSU ribosomal protein L16P